MINKDLYEALLNSLSKSTRYKINETLGTLLLGHPEVESLIYEIIDDIENRRMRMTFYNDKNNIPELGDFKCYKNIYVNTGIEWLKILQVIIAPDIAGNIHAAALLDNDTATIMNEDKNIIELGTIILHAPLKYFDTLETDLYHELNHYYSLIKLSNNVDEIDNDKLYRDIETYYKNDKQIYFIHKDIVSNTKEYIQNELYISTLIYNMLYYLNGSELKAHIETAFGEIKNLKYITETDFKSHSNVYKTYNNIYEILNIFKDCLKRDNISNYKTLEKCVLSIIGKNIKFYNNKSAYAIVSSLHIKAMVECKKINKLIKFCVDKNNLNILK